MQFNIQYSIVELDLPTDDEASLGGEGDNIADSLYNRISTFVQFQQKLEIAKENISNAQSKQKKTMT